jgi:class 3 adenylate cyclase
MPSVRRLTAILAADVAGYSRLMGADEEGTHERLRAHLRELIEPKIAEHHGRIIKNTGDGFLAEFASIVDGVRCAVEVQRGMAERNEAFPPEKRIEFRIGINLGDVIAEADDIFGDGVNIAARLEALAEPGSVFVSNTAYDHVRDRLPFTFEDLGEQQVKNIARAVRVYRVRDTAAAESPAAQTSPALPLPDKPSIAVLPFANMSGDPEQEYFADGMVEEIITALSRIRWLSARRPDVAASCASLPTAPLAPARTPAENRGFSTYEGEFPRETGLHLTPHRREADSNSRSRCGAEMPRPDLLLGEEREPD